jgi:GPH family glycoside/pentoside/hexuronide:cation symporter
VTKPEDRISFAHKVIYGLGAFVNNILAGAIGGMLIILNLGLGMDPALVGLLGALPRMTDAITDPLMGFLSDNAKTKWGRRRPFIFGGAIIAGLVYALLWQLPRDQSDTFYFVYFLIGSIIFYLAYTVFATPWVALGYELTPDYHERTRLMGVQNFFGQFAYLISPWFLWLMTWEGFGYRDQIQGASRVAIGVGVLAALLGVLPAIFLRERLAEVAASELEHQDARQLSTLQRALAGTKDFFKGFATSLRSVSFLKLCLATFLVFNGFILIASFQFYVIIYYVFGGDQETGAQFAGYSGTLQGLASFVIIIFVTWLATRVGKRKAFFVSTGISMIGYSLKWFCYDPNNPWLLLLPAPLMAFGLGGLFTIMPSMIADVVDEDELNTHQRREGMYGAIFWWVVKVGMAAALAGGGVLLNMTGFDVELGGDQAAETIVWMRLLDAFVPTFASLIAILSVASYSITEARAEEIRAELEARRTVPPADPEAEPLGF